MLLHDLFSNLKIIHHHKKEESEYAHVPDYTPTILKKIEGDHQHHHHHHVYHLHQSESHAPSAYLTCGPKGEEEQDSSLFVAEPGTERRGTFRTNEPIWVCTASVALEHKADVNGNGLIILDDQSQKLLENAYKNKTMTCQLAEDSATGSCTVHFAYDGTAFTSTTTVTSNDNTTGIRQLTYDTDIKRMITPVWWFEKKGLNGKKELSRFDWKNQIRLEAYDDANATLALTDDSFPEPFTAVLSQAKHKDAQEWQGFIYLDTVPCRGSVCDSNDEESEDEYHDLNIQGKDNFPNFNNFNDEENQEELRQEEAYRKAHITRK
ncbi:hypothetical protein INT46_003663 [Mucor plumbeus]|uniref:Uncharacterized protein n=1 Tax=Mucor plumbeus TaxID=97098 RepID=A0A8H7REC4_9FUNG|nr:hypothetical protein INT46_003663 [Mucor plumbeus]